MSSSDNMKTDIVSTIFDIALSFSGKDRPFVSKVANKLSASNYVVFYDWYFASELPGVELITFLRKLYYERAKYCAVFVSQHYSSGKWSNNVERPAILDRSVEKGDDYLIPVLLDDSWLNGLPKSIGYIDAREKTAEAVAKLLAEKIGPASLPICTDDLMLFERLSKDYILVGQILDLFQKSPQLEYHSYSCKEYHLQAMNKVLAIGEAFKQLGFCDCNTNIDFLTDETDCDRYVNIELTEKGKKFRLYLKTKFFK